MSVSTGLQFVIGANVTQFLSSIARSQRAIARFTGQMKGLAGISSGLFAGIQISRTLFFFDSLAEKAQAIRPAFDRLNQPRLLANLRRSVSGTISDLELMRQAVRASNFQIPIEKLGMFFKFAQVRAKETGESVQYLTESIISGVGRKAPLILDNLGISAVRMRQALKGVATETASIGDVAEAVAEVIREDWAGGIPVLRASATATERLSTAWTNFGEKVGTSTIDTTTQLKERLIELLETIDNDDIKAFGELMRTVSNGFLAMSENIALAVKGYRALKEAYNDLPEPIKIGFKIGSKASQLIPGGSTLAGANNLLKIGKSALFNRKSDDDLRIQALGLFGNKGFNLFPGQVIPDRFNPAQYNPHLFGDAGLKDLPGGLKGARRMLDNYLDFLKGLDIGEITPARLAHLDKLKQAVSDLEDALDPERVLRRNFEEWKRTMEDLSKTVGDQAAYLGSLRGKDGRFSKRGQGVLDKFLNSEGGDQLGISDKALAATAQAALARGHQNVLNSFISFGKITGEGKNGPQVTQFGKKFKDVNSFDTFTEDTEKNVNKAINAVNALSNVFSNLFANIANGGKDALDVITELVGGLLQAAAMFAGPAGPLLSLFGGFIKSTPSFVTRGGDIKHSGALTSRTQRYSS